MVVERKVEGSAIPDGSVPRVRQRLLLLASISARDFLWIHSAPTASSEAAYSASKHLRFIADNADSFTTISAPHDTSCDVLALRTGRRSYSRPQRLLDIRRFYYVLFFERKSEVQDIVRDASPTTTRSVLSNMVLRRSISCSVLGSFCVAPNQRAAPPTRRFLCAYGAQRLPAVNGARLRPFPRLPRFSLTPQRLR
ncbi:hypothetical protein B0H19DRAFT_1257441 [Mycena capillaripes]|nr:hypothetical protein B0H19DRAFT_1257441 [Mycena capillaripes]